MEALAFALALGIRRAGRAASFRLPLDGCDPSTQLPRLQHVLRTFEEHPQRLELRGQHLFGHRGTTGRSRQRRRRRRPRPARRCRARSAKASG